MSLAVRYELVIKPKAVKQLRKLDPATRRRIDRSILLLADDLTGDVKKLLSHQPKYRLRVGSFRVLFDIADRKITIEMIVNRKDAY